MTSFVNKLKEADELYQKGVRCLDETMLHNIKRFLVSDKKRFMVARVNVPYQVIGSIKKSLDTFEPKLKSKYGMELRCLTWDQCADIVKTSKIISKLPGLMFLDYDKLEVKADDLELLRKITERMVLNKNARIIIFISPNTKGLCNLLKRLENNSYFDFDYSTTKVDLQFLNRVQKPPSLMKAVLLGDCDEVNLLIACGKNVNTNDLMSDTEEREAWEKIRRKIILKFYDRYSHKTDSFLSRSTPLLLAAICGHTQVVHILLAHNANVNIINKDGETPLHVAAYHGRSKIVQVLLDHGANFLPNKRDETPLHSAVFENHTEVVDILLARNPNVNAINIYGETPLHAAAENRQSKIVQALLDHGAKFLLDECGRTPLHLAVYSSCTEVVDILLASNANVNEICPIFGETPLHAAAKYGRSKIVQALLDHGANFLPNKRGETPLYLAVLECHTEVVDILLARNANVNEITERGETPLHAAAENGQSKIVKVLLDRGANFLPNKRGETPLHLAVFKCYTEVVDILLAGNPNVNAINICGETPLHAAAENGQIKIVQALLDHGANFLPNKDGKTPLHWAAQKGYTGIADILLAHNANVNEIDTSGETPLHWASKCGHNDIVIMLIEYGAKNNKKDGSGCSPLDRALQRNHTQVINTLRHYWPSKIRSIW